MSRHIKAEHVKRGDLPAIPPSEIVVVHADNTRLFQPDVSELVDSLRIHGQIQSCIVRPLTDGRVQLVAGYRRWMAAQIICEEQEASGIPPEDRFKLKCEVQNLSPEEALDINLLENSERQSLSDVECAHAIRRLRNLRGWTGVDGTNKIANLFRGPSGRKRSTAWVYQTEDLLTLSQEQQEQIHRHFLTDKEEGISRSVGVVLTKIPEENRGKALDDARLVSMADKVNIPQEATEKSNDPVEQKKKISKGNAHIRVRDIKDVAETHGAQNVGRRDVKDLLNLISGYFDGSENLRPLHPVTKKFLLVIRDYIGRKSTEVQFDQILMSIDGCMAAHYDTYNSSKVRKHG